MKKRKICGVTAPAMNRTCSTLVLLRRHEHAVSQAVLQSGERYLRYYREVERLFFLHFAVLVCPLRVVHKN